MYSHIYLYMQLVYNVDLCEYLTKYFIKLHKTLSWVLSCLFTCICKWKCIFWHLVDIVFVYILEFTIPNFMKLFWVPPKLHWFQELLICRTYLKRFCLNAGTSLKIDFMRHLSNKWKFWKFGISLSSDGKGSADPMQCLVSPYHYNIKNAAVAQW